MAPPETIVRVGVGRDAADIAFLSIYGPSELVNQSARCGGSEKWSGDGGCAAALNSVGERAILRSRDFVSVEVFPRSPAVWLGLAILTPAPASGASLAGQDDPRFVGALDLWLADDEAEALPALAALAAQGNRAAQVLLALIDANLPYQGPGSSA